MISEISSNLNQISNKFILSEILGIDDLANYQISTREAFGKALRYYGRNNPDIVVLDADLAGSTKLNYFAASTPERFFNIGIAEQDMVSIAAGLATCGKTVVAATFAVFLTCRALDQIRNMVALNNLNVKLVGTHAGISTGQDGASHQAIEDIAVFRAIPNIKILSPADGIEAVRMTHYMLNSSGPIYLRLSRPSSKLLGLNGRKQENGYQILSYFEKANVSIFATGIMVDIAIKVKEMLEKYHIITNIVNISIIKPLSKKVVYLMNESSNFLFSLEDHSIIGGLGSGIAEVLAEIPNSKSLTRIGLNDKFGASGSFEELFSHYGLNPSKIFQQIIATIKRCNSTMI